jgi:hypothetical protein
MFDPQIAQILAEIEIKSASICVTVGTIYSENSPLFVLP